MVKNVTKPRDGRWKRTQPRVENPRTGARLPKERRVPGSDAGLPEAPGCWSAARAAASPLRAPDASWEQWSELWESGEELRYFGPPVNPLHHGKVLTDQLVLLLTRKN